MLTQSKPENILHRNVTPAKTYQYKNICDLSLMAFRRAWLHNYSSFPGKVSDFIFIMFISVPLLFQFVYNQSCWVSNQQWLNLSSGFLFLLKFYCLKSPKCFAFFPWFFNRQQWFWIVLVRDGDTVEGSPCDHSRKRPALATTALWSVKQ